MQDNGFDALLWLEDQFYQEGYWQGFQNGITRARVEGRIQGIEVGYATFLQIGRMCGRCDIWKWRAHDQSRVMRQLIQLERYLNQLISIPHRAQFESLWKKSKAKFKVITRLLGEEGLIEETDVTDMEDTRLIASHLSHTPSNLSMQPIR